MLEGFYLTVFIISIFMFVLRLEFMFNPFIYSPYSTKDNHIAILAVLIFSIFFSGFMLRKSCNERRLMEGSIRLYNLCVESREFSECKKVSRVTFENQQNLSVMESCIKNQKNTVDGCLEGLKSTYRFMPEEQELKKEIEPPSNKSASISIRVSSAWGASEFIYSGDGER